MKAYACSAFALFLLSCTTPQARPDTATAKAPAVENGAARVDRATDEPDEPDDELAPFDDAVEIAEDQVTFSSNGDELRGSVLRPEGSDEPRPGIVIAHDFGPLSRDGLIEGGFGLKLPVIVPVYRSLAESLAERGFVVLIYDKRTCVEGAAPECSYPRSYIEREAMATTLVEDLHAAALSLNEREDVASVTLIGHGHGAEIAVAAAAIDGDFEPDQVVLLAPSARSVEERVRFQTATSVKLLDAQIAELGDTTQADLLKRRRSTARQTLDELEAGFEAIDSGKTDGAVLGLPGTTWMDYRSVHARYVALMKSGETPIFAIMPAVDPGAPPDDAERLAGWLGADSGAVETIDGLSPAVVEVGEDDDATVVSPRTIELLLEIL